MTRALMLQGTGSDVGKSLIAAGLARSLANRGLAVRPFKPQNMSNNAAVTMEGGEIGRAQAVQALAARVPPSVHMNPLLLKPESPTGCQVILQGQRVGAFHTRDFMRERTKFMPKVLESFHILARQADIIIVEGAGSPAEVNLREGDLANMGFAEAANVNVILVGDIHRGGVIASIVGTFAILAPPDAARIKGIIINNFHGDISLFEEGRRLVERSIAAPVLGVIPHFAGAAKLPAEDSLGLDRRAKASPAEIEIAVLRFPRISNFDDLDPLQLEPGVNLTFVQEGQPIGGNVKLVVLPGSKSTAADLAFIKAQGWDVDLKAHVRRDGHVIGICGGYQMLGRAIHDPDGLEGAPSSVSALGLLDVETTLEQEKTLKLTHARHAASNTELNGYEIHLGRTSGPDCERPFSHVDGRPEGARSADGKIAGTYLHGCFANDDFRRALLSDLGRKNISGVIYQRIVDDTLDDLAVLLEKHLDLDRVLEIASPIKTLHA